jgi:hypothetical protein
MLLAAYWLECCMRKHKVCKDLATEGPLPFRIIDISNPESPILALGSNKHESYVTLSYKWGLTPKYLTTSQNLVEHTTLGIPLEKLPKTFKDAIFVASSLGFRWLWIDALCICQDVPAELSQQIHSMHTIFQVSTLTIFATTGADADSGLTVTRDPRWIRPCKLTIKTTVRGKSTTFSSYTTINGGKRKSEILYSRGWYVIVDTHYVK